MTGRQGHRPSNAPKWQAVLHTRYKVPAATGLALHANLNNLLNRKYWASGGWGAGNPGEARNLSVTLATTF